MNISNRPQAGKDHIDWSTGSIVAGRDQYYAASQRRHAVSNKRATTTQPLVRRH